MNKKNEYIYLDLTPIVIFKAKALILIKFKIKEKVIEKINKYIRKQFMFCKAWYRIISILFLIISLFLVLKL